MQKVIKHFQKDCRLLQVWLLLLCSLLLRSLKAQVPDFIYRLFVLRARLAKMCRFLSWWAPLLLLQAARLPLLLPRMCLS